MSRSPIQRSGTRQLVAQGAVVTSLGLVTKAVGQLRESFAAAVFGADRAMDAFNIAKSIPDMFSSWIETPIRSAIVPLFTRRLHEEGEEAAWRAASNIINTLAVAMILLTAALWLGSDALVRMLSTGFQSSQAWNESASLARIVIISVIFSVLTEILGSLSNVYGRQAVPAIGRLINGIVVVFGVVVLGRTIGLSGYAWGFLLGSIAYFLLQTNIIWRHRRYYRFVLHPGAPEIREILRVGLPLFIGMIGPRIDVLIDQNFASFLPGGQLTILNFMRNLSGAATDVVQTVSLAVLLPHFAGLMAQRQFEEVRRRATQVLGGYLVFAVPIAVFVAVGAPELVDILYRHGSFSDHDALLAAGILPLLALADPAFATGQILAQVHISGGDTSTPMKVGFWRIGFKALLSLALIGPLGIYGLAIATSASSFFRTFELWRRLSPAVRPSGSGLLRVLGGLFVPALLTAAAVWGLFRFLPAFPGGLAGQLARAVLVAGAGFALHTAVAWWTGHALVAEVIARARGRRVRPPGDRGLS